MIAGFTEFFNAYIEAALWSSNDESDETGGQPLNKNYKADDLPAETTAKMKDDCSKFWAANHELITNEDNYIGSGTGSVETQAGYDFWLTRNGHGCGFWDGDWADEAGEKLTAAAKAFGECDLYLGDDKKIYCFPA